MAKTSIYLPDDLAEQVRAHGISISEVAQRALWLAVREAQVKEAVMTDIQAVAERLRVRRAADAEAALANEVAGVAKARAYGAKWAQTTASAEELEYLATFDATRNDYRMPLSLVFFVSGENQRDHRAHAGHGMPGPSGVPTSPDDPYWTDLQGAVREVWESVKPLLAEL